MTTKAQPQTLSEYFSQSKQYPYKKGEIILRPDDTPSGVYYLEKGYIKSYSITENGDENLLVILKSGELFPLRWIFGYTRRKIFYEAIAPVTLRRMPKDDFVRFIDANPLATHELLQNIMAKYNVYVERIENLELTNAYPRVIKRLLSLAERFGKKTDTAIILEAPIKHNDIASSINMSRETASRELETLKKKGIIDDKNHIITIKNKELLENELIEYMKKKT
jgi:CRP/FNR family transcriptional regulator